MAYEQLCMYCFEDLQGQVICPHCGRDSRAAVPQIQMLPGTTVYHDRFLVGRALGQDATGIVYAAFDTKRENKLRLREYLPRDCAERLNDGTVVPIAGLEDQFEKGMKKLRASVEGVEDPKKRHFYFEENGTAYIAQRKTGAAAAAAAHDDGEDEGGSGFRQIGLIVGIAAAVVVVAAIVIVSLVNGALKSSDDLVQNPTLQPSASANLWVPEATASPTPYVSPTFAALVDPEQSWMDYTYAGDVNQEFQNQLSQSATATPKPTLGNSSSDDYQTVGGNSSNSEVTTLQQRLAALGWLSSSKITGKYDSATKQAVKDFQTYVNNTFQPAEKLSVDGIAGPKTQQWLYATEAVKPTPTPTAVVTPNPDDGTVDKNSSKTDIKAVQRKLIVLGLMSSGSDDGVYGTTTAAAVKKFQQRVNQLQGYAALEVTGVVDPDTMAYLNYYVEWWQSLQQATATPEPVLPTTPTPAPTEAPTPAPTDAPDKEETGATVDKDSPKESIAFVQEMLIGVGLLEEGSNDGVYGSGTANAVIAFQQWVNSQVGEGTLSVTGVADQNTLNYLEYAYGNGMTAKPTEAPQVTETPTQVPTEAPTEAPTAAPTETPAPTDAPDKEEGGVTVDKDSEPESIAFVQEMLIGVGLLEEGSNDGVYGSGTANAVATFQQWVNDQVGEGTLEVTGVADQNTLSYLEYAYSNGMVYQPAEPTEAPATEAPATEAPATEAPATEAPVEDTTVGAGSSKESVQRVQQLLIQAGLLSEGSDDGDYGSGTTNAVLKFQQYVNDSIGDSILDETGIADADTQAYLEEFVSRGMTVPSDEPTEAPATEAPAVEPVEVTLSVGGTETVNGVHAVTGDKITFSWGASGAVSEYYVYVYDQSGDVFFQLEATDRTSGEFGASSLNPGEVYTITIGALPAGGDETSMSWTEAQFGVPAQQVQPEETEAPAEEEEEEVIKPVPVISIDGAAYNENGVQYITSTQVIFSWIYEGDLQGYMLYMTNSAGDRRDLENTTGTSLTMDLSGFPADTYTLHVGAVPVGAQSESDVIWGSTVFALAN